MPLMDTKTVIEKIGGVRATAELCGVSHQAVYQWRRVPPQHVLKICKVIKCEPQQIRPDVFGEVAA